MGYTPQIFLEYVSSLADVSRLEKEAVRQYQFDFDDDLDTSGINDDVLALRSYEV
jgi:hypothetical protein